MVDETTTFTPNEQYHNLRKLGEYLLAGNTRMRFSMETYCSDETLPNLTKTYVPEQHECGTVGCALGHGPEATGVSGLPFENWGMYARRVFGVYDRSAYVWLFDAYWQFKDNTPEGTGRRILNYLEHGLPGDWVDQLFNKS